jgi:hypothetical protein
VKYYTCSCTLVSLNRCPTNLVVLEPGILRYKEKDSKSERGEMRPRIQLLWTKSHGAKLYQADLLDRRRIYAHQADLLDRRPIYCHNIIRDSGFWSPQEERQVRPGQFWLMKFGKVPGTNSCVEKATLWER